MVDCCDRLGLDERVRPFFHVHGPQHAVGNARPVTDRPGVGPRRRDELATSPQPAVCPAESCDPIRQASFEISSSKNQPMRSSKSHLVRSLFHVRPSTVRPIRNDPGHRTGQRSRFVRLHRTVRVGKRRPGRVATCPTCRLRTERLANGGPDSAIDEVGMEAHGSPTHQVALDEAPGAYRDFQAKNDGMVKAAITDSAFASTQ